MTTDSLREEIRRDVIHKLIDDRNCDYEDITKYIDEIISIFEKRIESKIPSMETPPDMDERGKYFHQGYITGMRKVKEMLK